MVYPEKSDFYIIFIVCGLLLLLVQGQEPLVRNSLETIVLEEVKEEEAPVELVYGLPADSFQVFRDVIKPNQFLANILSSYGVPYVKIDQLVKKAKGKFSLTKIRKGKHFAILTKKDSIADVRHFVYEPNATEYVRIDFTDSIDISFHKKEITYRVRKARAVINSSLWNALKDNGLDIALSGELSDVYAWTIDFFGLTKGDAFNILYEEKCVDTLSVGINRILAANFIHNDSAHFALYYENDTMASYFDLMGNSLKRAFLKAPLNFRRISSGFSYSRFHPILKKYRPHLGVDYAAAVGTPVYAIGDGKVIAAVYRGQAGKMVKIKHNSVYTSGYLHLSKFGEGVKSGVRVKQGQVIGYVGSTGLSTGPHLDFRCWKNGKAVNPLKIESPPVNPISLDELPKFIAFRDSVINILENKPLL